ncbi:MAG: 4-alpha-glucanotransferase, partial [Oscillospiraceae bacterium]|nr:4-alpha-glucanotransferase [Oscillospiraceae bacterium]
MRTCGVLMPVSSLNGRYGIGTFGKEAYEFVDFLSEAGQGIWQILPLGPTGYGDSPYQSCSAFAGNPYFIDPDGLVADGLLTEEDVKPLEKPNTGSVDYGWLYNTRFALLRKAYKAFTAQRPVAGYDTWKSDEYYRFLFLNEDWLEEYALYRAAQKVTGMKALSQWPEELYLRTPAAMEQLKKDQAEEIGFWKFVEFEFWKQWTALRKYAASKKIKILGDMPLYVSADSADAWFGGRLFETDAKGRPSRVAGCPPDYFAKDGQLWGNPLYAWDYHRATGYAWWCRRVRHALDLYDLVRIDHFRGIDTYWAIPADAETAKTGKWENGPGMELFNALRASLGGLPLVAEDLGEMFDSVRTLLKDSTLPGMKVLQFAFSGPANEYLPHNHLPNCLVYTGTHDNNTLAGWLADDAGKEEKAFAMKYLRVAKEEDLADAILCAALASCGDTCILPLADWLGLGSQARINTPGKMGANWAWRAQPGCLTPALAARMKELCILYGRTPQPKPAKAET